jgi:DNA polymerase-3 subunit delta'
MSWDLVIGQERVKVLLKHILQSKQIAHAYLFYGPEGIGKDALAIEFAKTLNCIEEGIEACGTCSHCRWMLTLQHPNLNIVFALPLGKGEKTGDDPITVLTENQVTEVKEQIRLKASDPYHRIEISKANTIKINSIRQIKRESVMSKTVRGKKVILIFNAEMMNIEASNSLLKTLEEPLPETILLLTSSSKDQLLLTIVSRCHLIQCDLLSDDEIENAIVTRDGADRTQARLIAQLANGSYGVARRSLKQNMAEERSEVVEFLRLVLGKQKTALLTFIDELSSTVDRSTIERWLILLESWLRDALLLTQHSSIPMFEADKNSLESFVVKYPHANLLAAIRSVESAIAHLNKNIYLNLLLLNLAINLRKNIEQNTSI